MIGTAGHLRSQKDRKKFRSQQIKGSRSSICQAGSRRAFFYSEGKQKLDPELVATAELVADVVQQAITVGEYEKALKIGRLTKSASR